MGLCETVPYSLWSWPLAELFCDARGSPPRVAAVLFHGGAVSYTDVEPSAALMNALILLAQ